MGHLRLNGAANAFIFTVLTGFILRLSLRFMGPDYSSGVIAVGGAVSSYRLISDVMGKSSHSEMFW